MSIESKHAYRFGFLKSEEWEHFRIMAQIAHGAVCCVCGKKSFRDGDKTFSNDVHHVYYPSSWKETKIGHVVILCRRHHKAVHSLMEKYPKMNKGTAVKIVRIEVVSFRGMLWGLKKFSRKKLSLERWCEYQQMIASTHKWRWNKKLRSLGRHEQKVDSQNST